MNYLQLIQHLPKNLHSFIRREPGWIIPNLLLTYYCTQRCLQCSIPLKADHDMVLSVGQADQIADRLIAHGTQGVSISGGEPLSHPDLFSILNLLADKRFAFLHVLTNLYASSERIDKLVQTMFERRIHVTTSFDGFGQVADTIRGAPQVADHVMEAMEKINRMRKKGSSHIQTRATVVLSQLNLHQAEDILNYLERMDWEVSVDIYRCSSIQHQDADELHITDLDLLEGVIRRSIRSKHVITPDFLLKGYVSYLKDDFPKKCPYLDAPTLGSKFFIQPNGDVLVCTGGPVGNIFSQTPREIIRSDVWKARIQDFTSCRGCWNPCYTTFTGLSPLAQMVGSLKKVTSQRNRHLR